MKIIIGDLLSGFGISKESNPYIQKLLSIGLK
jgi:hypothetical protein